MQRLFAAFYGDDFTGATENLAQFSRHGLRGRLFFNSANRDTIVDMASELDVVGLAGTARGLAPQAMTQEVAPALALIDELNPRVKQFKVCSTFDSSPTVGSIGHVMDLARRQWPGCALPVLPATPSFGRYVAFSNLFTRYQGEVCRLDQNPAMVHHPSTPMAESDLRTHLLPQTAIPNAVVTLLDYQDADGGWQRLVSAVESERFVVLDATNQAEMTQVAGLILKLSELRSTVAVAAQGLADAMGSLVAKKSLGFESLPTSYSGVDRLLVLSGSCSPQTRSQLEHLEAEGGHILSASPNEAIRNPEALAKHLAQEVLSAFKFNKSVAITTTRSEADLITKASPDRLALAVGEVYAYLARMLRRKIDIPRIVFAGGDTSSHAMRKIGAEALELVAFDEMQGGHLSRLIAPGSSLDGLEVVLKGGQFGDHDFFSRVKFGTKEH